MPLRFVTILKYRDYYLSSNNLPSIGDISLLALKLRVSDFYNNASMKTHGVLFDLSLVYYFLIAERRKGSYEFSHRMPIKKFMGSISSFNLSS